MLRWFSFVAGKEPRSRPWRFEDWELHKARRIFPGRCSDPAFAPKEYRLLCSKAKKWALTFIRQNHLNHDPFKSIK